MAFSFLPELAISILVLLAVALGLRYVKSSKNKLLSPPVHWPLVSILPSVVLNLHRLHDYVAFDPGHDRGAEEEGPLVKRLPVDAMSHYINDPDYDEDLLQATLISYMIDGRDTISTALPWIVYNLAKNPHVVSSILDELAPIASRKAAISDATTVIFEAEEVRPLVYLEATSLETLSLYPSVPIVGKSVASTDVMPSGHQVRGGTSSSSPSTPWVEWRLSGGADCREYRPKRWLSKDRRHLRHVAPNNFMAFNSGPRMGISKNIAIIQLKIIVAAVAWNFDMKMSDGQAMGIKRSTLLQFKNGLKVKLNMREM